MSQNDSVKISEFSIENYIRKYNISDITKSKLDTKDIVVLPLPYENEKYFFAQETINFIKYCKVKNSKVDIDILAEDKDIEIRSLHSFDLWMPAIFISSDVVLPILINLISDYISSKIFGRETENTNIEIKLIKKNGDDAIELYYKGDAKNFKETLENTDIWSKK